MPLTARQLFPRECPLEEGIPLQGRILIRNAEFMITADDVRTMIAQGVMRANDDPDEAHDIGVFGVEGRGRWHRGWRSHPAAGDGH